MVTNERIEEAVEFLRSRCGDYHPARMELLGEALDSWPKEVLEWAIASLHRKLDVTLGLGSPIVSDGG